MYNFSDNVPTVLLKSWPLDATLFDGDLIAGPVPTLFSVDIEGTASAILHNPVRCHSDVSRMTRVFFMPENITTEEAIKLAKKPR